MTSRCSFFFFLVCWSPLKCLEKKFSNKFLLYFTYVRFWNAFCIRIDSLAFFHASFFCPLFENTSWTWEIDDAMQCSYIREWKGPLYCTATIVGRSLIISNPCSPLMVIPFHAQVERKMTETFLFVRFICVYMYVWKWFDDCNFSRCMKT